MILYVYIYTISPEIIKKRKFCFLQDSHGPVQKNISDILTEFKVLVKDNLPW